ncbi:hypothetical protein A5775_10390 [Mycobacterium sp. 852002-10029_SCH5224772]|nr:hypothetical protein A5775_10390 [Mycobacterium sp. 852002-10029_SCH5224772]
MWVSARTTPAKRDADAVLGHPGVDVPDPPAAKACYDARMPLLGFEPFVATADEFAYRPGWSKPGTYRFMSPESVPPSSTRLAIRRNIPGGYYAAIWYGPFDSTRLEAECDHDRV